MPTTPKIQAKSGISLIPRRQTLSRIIHRFLEMMDDQKIPTKNIIITGGGSFPRIHADYQARIEAIYDAVILKEFNLDHEDQILLRTVNDDCRHGLTDKFYDISRILEIYLPRYKDKGDVQSSQTYAKPLEGEQILSWEEITDLFVNESLPYIRKRISQTCLEENTSILPIPEDGEIADLEMADGEWLVNQASNEGIALQAVLNYNVTDLRRIQMPRFQYISKAMGPLREITEIVPTSRIATMRFVTCGANALFAYFRVPRDDETDIEAIDLFSSYQNFRGALGSHRENAMSILTRLNNGKPAYKDLLNLARRYRGLHYWGLETLIRQTIPLLKMMFEAKESREEVVTWLRSSGVLDSYQKHKRFYVKMDS